MMSFSETKRGDALYVGGKRYDLVKDLPLTMITVQDRYVVCCALGATGPLLSFVTKQMTLRERLSMCLKVLAGTFPSNT